MAIAPTVRVACDVAPGAFSGERVIRVRRADLPEDFVGIAPAGMCVGDDRVLAYLVERRDGRARVELPCGSVVWVEGASIS